MSKHSVRDAFDGAQPFEAGTIDTSVLSSGRRPPPPFPAALFSPVLSRFAAETASGCSAPIDYIGGSILAVAAAAIGGSRSAQAYPFGGWVEPPILWVGLVGEPSTVKSPAIDAITRPLRDIERELALGYAETLRRFNTDELAAKHEKENWAATVKSAIKDGLAPPVQRAVAVSPVRPARPRLLVKDATPEAVQVIMHSNARLLCNRDELTGFLDFERYNSGGRSYWLEAYGGRTYTVDRKSAEGPIIIPFNGISVLGGIQPDKLAGVFEGADDGLAARFMWLWPVPTDYEAPTVSADAPRWAWMVSCLATLPFGHDAEGVDCAVPLQLEPDAADAYIVRRKANARSARDGSGLFKGMVGKMPGVVMRLCLVLELLDWAETGGPEPDTICLTVLHRVLEFVELYLKPMALRVFGDAALPQVERNATTIARHIIRSKAKSVNLRRLQRLRLPGLGKADLLREALELLKDAGWLLPAGIRAGETTGKTTGDFKVNPLAHTIDLDKYE